MAFEVPCTHEGDAEACGRCWASHSDAEPYCMSDEYKKKRAQQKLQQREPSRVPVDDPHHSQR